VPRVDPPRRGKAKGKKGEKGKKKIYTKRKKRKGTERAESHPATRRSVVPRALLLSFSAPSPAVFEAAAEGQEQKKKKKKEKGSSHGKRKKRKRKEKRRASSPVYLAETPSSCSSSLNPSAHDAKSPRRKEEEGRGKKGEKEEKTPSRPRDAPYFFAPVIAFRLC